MEDDKEKGEGERENKKFEEERQSFMNKSLF